MQKEINANGGRWSTLDFYHTKRFYCMVMVRQRLIENKMCAHVQPNRHSNF